MDKNQEMYDLGVRAWEHRRTQGFSKGLPEEIKMEAGRLVSEGFQLAQMAKVLGITTTTVHDWKQRYLLSKKSKEPSFNEVAVADDKTKFEIKLSATVLGCRVELSGTDYALLQRLLRKLGA
ncbi:helix-turn-helix domain-containing protein [bacterium]|nr:helix-turn-helix domain-containing protein [bacterium]